MSGSHEKTVIVTRSMDERLYRLSGELCDLPFERLRLTGTAADDYFYRFNEIDADWIINLDEDAFVINSEGILTLLEHMQREGFDCCGVPDGGVISHRFHNPISPNPYFSIHHNRRIRERFNLAEIEAGRFGPDLLQYAPQALFKPRCGYQYDDFEPYYKYFFWLLRSGFKMLYLDAGDWVRDPISTITFDHMHRKLLVHAWYARDYDNQHWRFHQAMNYCRALKAAPVAPALTQISVGVAVGGNTQTAADSVQSALSQAAACRLEVLAAAGPRLPERAWPGIEDDRFRVIRVERPSSQAAARNACLAHMTGDFFIWLGEGDFLMPNALAACLRYLNANPDADVLYGDLLVGEENSAWRRKYAPLSPLAIPGKLLFEDPFPGAAALISKKLIDRVGAYDEGLQAGIHLDLWRRAAAAECAFVHVPEIVCRSRRAYAALPEETVLERIVETFPRRVLLPSLNWEKEPIQAEMQSELVIAAAFSRCGHYRAALKYAEQGLSLRPTPVGLVFRGLIYRKLNRFAEAADALAKGLGSGPELEQLIRMGDLL